MNADAPLAECECGGARLTLYGNRVACRGEARLEVVPLAQLAAVRVAFERDARALGWAIALAVVALLVAAAAGPLRDWVDAAAARIGDTARRETFDAVLLSAFNGLAAFARLLPVAAAALGAGAAGLAFVYWRGRTTLALSFAASERVFAAGGRDQYLVEFAEAVAERIAARKAP